MRCVVSVLMTFGVALTPAYAGTSTLWGTAGELWDPNGRLPDYSYAGYLAGETALPVVEERWSVLDFGAVGDGASDDTVAIQTAIDTAGASLESGESGAIWFPEGTYRLTGQLTVTHSGLVLRGAGQDLTRLSFEVSLTDIYGSSDSWSYSGGLLSLEGATGGEITTLVSDAARGDRSLSIAESSALSVGQFVIVSQSDDTGTLSSHLHNDQTSGGDCDWQQPYKFWWVVQVEAVEEGRVTFTQPLRTDVRLEWGASLKEITPLEQVGIEHLSVVFPETEYAGHLLEPGYNGITTIGGVANSWVRDVRFDYVDNAILADPYTKWMTFEDIVIGGRGGHHGFNLNHTADCLVSDIEFETDFVHALTVDHKSNGNVFRRVEATAYIELDHHRDAPFENLFTNISNDVSFVNGGSSCAGPPSGARETIWNVAGPLIPPYWGATQANVVGQLTVDDSLTEDAEWYENVEDLWPRDLYEAQRALRLGLVYEDTAAPIEETGLSASSEGCGCSVSGPPKGVLWGLGALVLSLATRRRRVECDRL